MLVISLPDRLISAKDKVAIAVAGVGVNTKLANATAQTICADELPATVN